MLYFTDKTGVARNEMFKRLVFASMQMQKDRTKAFKLDRTLPEEKRKYKDLEKDYKQRMKKIFRAGNSIPKEDRSCKSMFNTWARLVLDPKTSLGELLEKKSTKTVFEAQNTAEDLTSN